MVAGTSLGKYSPLVHLQQTDGNCDRHGCFTKAHNAEGVIRMDEVVEALEQSGADEVYLFPELLHPFEFPGRNAFSRTSILEATLRHLTSC
jgi:hypothetical protein